MKRDYDAERLDARSDKHIAMARLCGAKTPEERDAAQKDLDKARQRIKDIDISRRLDEIHSRRDIDSDEKFLQTYKHLDDLANRDRLSGFFLEYYGSMRQRLH